MRMQMNKKLNNSQLKYLSIGNSICGVYTFFFLNQSFLSVLVTEFTLLSA